MNCNIIIIILSVRYVRKVFQFSSHQNFAIVVPLFTHASSFPPFYDTFILGFLVMYWLKVAQNIFHLNTLILIRVLRKENIFYLNDFTFS